MIKMRGYMYKTINNEKGIALITALLVLAVLTLLGMAAILTSTTDMQIARNEKVSVQGQYAAEAGISHAIVWLNASSIEPLSGPTWSTAASAAAAVPPTTAQNAAALNWVRSRKVTIKDGTASFYTYSATVSYKQIQGMDPNYNGRVAFFNRSSGFGTAPMASGGWPVFVIRSIARQGNYQSQANILEVTKNSLNFQVRGGFTAGGAMNLNGNVDIDGRAHDLAGNVVAPGTGCRSASLSTSMPAVFSNGTTTQTGNAAHFYGDSSPIRVNMRGAATLPTTPWGALGIKSDSSDGVTVVTSDYANGPYFVDIFPNGPSTYPGTLDGSQWYKNNVTSLSGNGLLIVHNPLFVVGECLKGTWDGACDTGEIAPCSRCAVAKAPAVLNVSGNDIYNGMVIADSVDLSGGLKITGALMSLTTTSITRMASGTPDILYSCQAIEKYAAGQINKKLNWHKE